MQIHRDLQNMSECDPKSNVLSLQYQVGLLRERNRILALQNQNLMLRIQEFENLILSLKQNEAKYQKQKRSLNEIQRQQKLELVNLIKCIQKNIVKSDSTQVAILYQMMKNECSTPKIISQISSLLLSKQSKQTAKISNMNRLEKLVEKRKQKLGLRQSNNKQVVHIVKQPTWSQSYLAEADLQFILKSSEKLIRRVKKSQVSTQSLAKIFTQIQNYIQLRMSIRKGEKQLKIKQRELQLGVGCRIIFQQYSSQLVSLNNEELNKKSIIEQKIFQL